MKPRIVVYHNPKSSTHAKYLSAVHQPLVKFSRKNPDTKIIEIAITQPFEKTVQFVAKNLHDGDKVFAAGGDGTVSAILNGCLKSRRDVTFGIIGLGRGNDAARAISGRTINPIRLLSSETAKVFPLEIFAGRKHVRFALQHVVLGAAAETAALFDQQSRRSRNIASQSVAAGISETIKYLREVKGRVDELFPYHEHNSDPSNDNVICLSNGRVAKVFYPRIHGIRTVSAHVATDEFMTISTRIVGTSNDATLIASWALRGLPCVSTAGETFAFSQSEKILLSIDGEMLTVTTDKLRVRKSSRGLRVFAPNLAKVNSAQLSISRPNQPASD